MRSNHHFLIKFRLFKLLKIECLHSRSIDLKAFNTLILKCFPFQKLCQPVIFTSIRIGEVTSIWKLEQFEQSSRILQRVAHIPFLHTNACASWVGMWDIFSSAQAKWKYLQRKIQRSRGVSALDSGTQCVGVWMMPEEANQWETASASHTAKIGKKLHPTNRPQKPRWGRCWKWVVWYWH